MPKCMLSDEIELVYADIGAGQPIVLVHGWAAHGGFFQQLAERLAARWRVIVPTLRAHPGSGRGSAPLRIETLGKDLSELFEQLTLSGAVVVGWSMGAMALWAAMPRIAARVSGLIVEDMGVRLVDESDLGLGGGYSRGDAEATLADMRADWAAHVKRFAPRMFAPHFASRYPEVMAWAVAEMSAADPDAMACLWASMAKQDFSAALAHIEAPLLMVHGGDSLVITDPAADFVAKAAPRGRRVVIPRAGHAPHLEAPDTFFEAVSAFAREVAGQPIEGGKTR